jgi:hypothetical protein
VNEVDKVLQELVQTIEESIERILRGERDFIIIHEEDERPLDEEDVFWQQMFCQSLEELEAGNNEQQ